VSEEAEKKAREDAPAEVSVPQPRAADAYADPAASYLRVASPVVAPPSKG
jgi:hypothetical protein